MSYLENVTLDDLHRVLDDVDGKKPTLRVVVGINYKQGVSATQLANWYNLSRTTIYNWLARLERLTDDPPSTVLSDANRSGRPPKLSPRQHEHLGQVVAISPQAVGVDANEWTATTLQAYITDEFGVEFSQRHSRTLLDELRNPTPR